MYSKIYNGVVEIDDAKIHNDIVEAFDGGNLVNPVYPIPKFTLNWSRYLLFMGIADPVERAFYEREAMQGN